MQDRPRNPESSHTHDDTRLAAPAELASDPSTGAIGVTDECASKRAATNADTEAACQVPRPGVSAFEYISSYYAVLGRCEHSHEPVVGLFNLGCRFLLPKMGIMPAYK